MKRKLYFIFILQLCNLTSYSQIENFKINKLSGAIFSKHEPIVISDTIMRWTPSLEEVKYALEVCVEYLKANFIKKELINQGFDGCPIIYKNRSKYFYQIFGMVNQTGEKIIYINSIWKKSSIEGYKNEYISVLDGCSHFWSIKINIDSKSIVAFMVNGTS